MTIDGCYNRIVENELLQNLNPEQKRAVLATEGPVLVLAGAGSGKTKALTHRIAYLIKEKKVSPYNILAVTFTNKAAAEIASRVAKLLGSSKSEFLIPASPAGGSNQIPNPNDQIYKLPWAGTFHSVCVRILRREADFIGYARSFTIADSNDQISIIKRIMRDLEINPKNFNPSSIQYFISGAKNELIDAGEYKKYINSPFEKVTARVYERYQKYLRETNLMDFDDLIMNCVKLFQNNPAILEKYQKIFKYILIDEYQDTNQAQYVWVKLLAEKYKNIMVVGDDFQSIYSWRGANFRNILNFEKDYKDAKVIKLEQNYRSTKTILTAANDVIKFNKNKTDKKLWTQNSEGMPITVYQALNEKDEAEFVSMEIRSLIRNYSSSDGLGVEKFSTPLRTSYEGQASSNSNYSDIAVLYRTNAQSRAVEEAFLRFKIPYKIVGGFRFYERKEIKDVIAFLRLIYNPSDFEAFDRAVSAVSRGIGEKTVAKLRELPNYQVFSSAVISTEVEKSDTECHPEPVEGSLQDKISRQARDDKSIGEQWNNLSAKVQQFYQSLFDFYQMSLTLPLDQLILTIAEKSGYKKYLLDGTAEGEGRWENILELSTVAAQVEARTHSVAPMNDPSPLRGEARWGENNREIENFDLVSPPPAPPRRGGENLEDDNVGEEGSAIEQFLQQTALVQDTDQIESDGGVVSLMTLHSAKGLEFRAVFVVGAEEGLFPHSRALADENEMEEERRLCYVGITRAKERLYLIYAGERNLYGRLQFNEKSRFIENISECLLDII